MMFYLRANFSHMSHDVFQCHVPCMAQVGGEAGSPLLFPMSILKPQESSAFLISGAANAGGHTREGISQSSRSDRAAPEDPSTPRTGTPYAAQQERAPAGPPPPVPANQDS